MKIDRTNFMTDGFLQIIQRTGFVSVNTRFQIPPNEKNHTLKDRESEGVHGTSPKREMRCPGNIFRTMVIAKSPLLLKWPTQRKRMLTTSSPGKNISNNAHCQVSIATEVTNPEEKNANHLVSRETYFEQWSLPSLHCY